MRLVIVRHGKAEHDSPDGTDFARELRGRGERQAAFVGDRLAVMSPPVGRIVSSRAARAQRTALIIAERIGARRSGAGDEPALGVDFDDALLCDEPASGVVERLASWAEPIGRPGVSGGALVIVGHNPQLSMLAGLFGGGNEGLRTGEACVVEIDPADPFGGGFIERIRLDNAAGPASADG